MHHPIAFRRVSISFPQVLDTGEAVCWHRPQSLFMIVDGLFKKLPTEAPDSVQKTIKKMNGTPCTLLSIDKEHALPALTDPTV